MLFWRALADNWDEVSRRGLSFDWSWLAVLVLFAVAVPVSGLLWGLIVRRLEPGTPVGAREAMAVHSSSWLLKYIPGQVGSLLNKVLWGQRKGISRLLVVISFVYENVFLQLASIVPSIVILVLAAGVGVFQDNAGAVLLPLLAIVPLVAVSNRAVFSRLLRFAGRRFAKDGIPDNYFLRTPDTLLFQLAFVVPRIINGVGFVLLAASIAPIGPEDWLPLAATYAFAGAIGILAVFVPSGLGVREAVIVIFASQFLSLPDAIILSLLARLVSTLADALIALIYGGLRLSLRKDGA